MNLGPPHAFGNAHMNFNTSNQTYRHLMGNGLSYHVPTFQRDYSWDTETAFESESAKYGVEHVLPENSGDDWDQFGD